MQASTMNALRYAEFAGGFDPVCAGSALQGSKDIVSRRGATFDAEFTISNSERSYHDRRCVSPAASHEFRSMQRNPAQSSMGRASMTPRSMFGR
jgi:hypothetical protein